jgi:thiol:disulfide interchange protein DsbD
MPRAVPAERLRGRSPGAGTFVAAIAALVGMAVLSLDIGAAPPELKLLPPEEAFRLSARALDTRTLEANFGIAPGYYLYRDKLRFSLEPQDGGVGDVTLPAGAVKEDPFFGRVETYRDRVVVRLPLQAPRAAQTVTLRAESQGCADAGVCYPPQVQRLKVVVPTSDGRPGPLVEAPLPAKSWFR